MSLSPNATAGSSARNKVALKPGRSLMDWIRLTNSGQDLAGTGGKCLEISSKELAKHNTRTDAWISLRGNVYNITQYLEFHPGGAEELMRGAGKDATDLFNQVHRWVNAESMLQKCFIGILKKSWSLDVPKFQPLKHLQTKKKKSNPVSDISSNNLLKPADIQKLFPDSVIYSKEVASSAISPFECEQSEIQRTSIGKSEWNLSPYGFFFNSKEYELKMYMKRDSVILKFKYDSIRMQGLVTDLVDRKLFVKPDYLSFNAFYFDFGLDFKDNYSVTFQENELEVKLEFLNKEDRNALSKIQASDDIVNSCGTENDFVYWSCKLIEKVPVNHNTYLLTFLLPPGTKMWVPIGRHVSIKAFIEGVEVIRNYTPVISSLEKGKKLDESKIVFMIKMYQNGTMTRIINDCKIGENLWISNYTGSFFVDLNENSDSIVMLAAGSGITPMIRIIDWVANAKDRRRSVLLLFFNKTEKDILWEKEFQTLASIYEKFQVKHILSNPTESWKGLTGKINEELLLAKLPKLVQKIFICGPLPFTETALRCLEGANFNQQYIHVFSGS